MLTQGRKAIPRFCFLGFLAVVIAFRCFFINGEEKQVERGHIGVQIRGKEQENRSPSQSQSHNIRVRDTGRQQVVLLAGPHKTASSSIQRNLFHWLNGMTTGMLPVYPKNGPGLHHRKHSEKMDALWRAILKSSKFSIG